MKLDVTTKSLARALLLLAIVGAKCSAPAAQALYIANSGFESNTITPGAFVVLQPQSWITYDPGAIIDNAQNAVGVIRPSPGLEYFPAGAPEQNNAALIFLAGPQTAVVGLQQTLTNTLQPNTRYRLSAQVGNIASGTSLPGSSGGPGVFFNLDGFPGYRLDLLAGGVVIAADTNSIGATIPEGEFRRATLIFDTGTTNLQLNQTLGVRVVNLKFPATTNAPNIEVDFDDVRLLAGPIPGRATLAINLSGGNIGISITGTTGVVYRVEYSGALSASNWVTLTNLTLPISPFVVNDTVPGMTNRFYRALIME